MACFFNAKGRLEGCELWGNGRGGILVSDGGDLSLVGCSIRDHAILGGGSGYGVYVRSSAAGRAMVGADCAFANNAGGDVVREEAPAEVD